MAAMRVFAVGFVVVAGFGFALAGVVVGAEWVLSRVDGWWSRRGGDGD